jgi:taurine dioxygenase
MQIIHTDAALGADITDIDLAKDLDVDTIDAIKTAWAERLVLRIRGQGLNDTELLRFSRHFGELDKAPINPYGTTWVPEHPEINVISNILDDEDKRIGGLGDGEAKWHADMTYVDTPVRACTLYAIEIPESGGDTGFANMFAAYEALSEKMKAQLAGLQCKHDASRNSTGQLRNGFEADYADVSQVPGAIHPLVRADPDTGCRALYLGRRANAYVMGMAVDESEALLDQLWAHAASPEFTWTQQWQVGDLIMWDNRYCLHRRDAFDADTRRHMRRTQIGGDQPIAAGAA